MGVPEIRNLPNISKPNNHFIESKLKNISLFNMGNIFKRLERVKTDFSSEFPTIE